MNTAAVLARLEHQATRALLRKELRESTPAVIVGAVIFVGLPVLWTLLFAAITPDHSLVAGGATMLLLLAGWLFGAVVAAQTVCRDLGRAQGHFLLSRPVAVRQVLWAKACAGFGVVLAVVALAALLDGAIYLWSDEWPGRGALATATAATLGTFWIAFAAAAITRQTLSSVMLAGLVLVLVAVAPLIVSTLPDTYSQLTGKWENMLEAAQPHGNPTPTWGVPIPTWIVMSSGAAWVVGFVFAAVVVGNTCRAMFGQAAGRRARLAVFGAAIVLVLLFRFRAYRPMIEDVLLPVAFVALWLVSQLLFAASRLGARSERGLRLGTKSVAWTVALVLVLVFTTAMGQVGRNRPVEATYWLPAAPDGAPCWVRRVAAGARRVAVLAVYSGDRVIGSPVFPDDPLDAQLDDHLRSAQQAGPALAFFDINQSNHIRPAGTARTTPTTAAIPVFDDRDELYLIDVAPPPVDDRSLNSPLRFELRHIEWQRGSAGPPRELVMPTTRLPVRGPATAAIEGNRLYVVWARIEKTVPREVQAEGWILATYRLEAEQPLTLERQCGLPMWGNQWFHYGTDGRLYLVSRSQALDPSRADGGLTDFFHYKDAVYAEIGGQLVVDHDVSADSDYTGFHLMRIRTVRRAGTPVQFPEAQPLGSVPASLLGMAFRSSWPTLLAGGRGYVWEIHERSATAYDVRDVDHPRKVANVATYKIGWAFSGPNFLVLDHGPGFSIVRHPRP